MTADEAPGDGSGFANDANDSSQVGGVPQPKFSEERAGPPPDRDAPAGPAGPKGFVDPPRILVIDAGIPDFYSGWLFSLLPHLVVKLADLH